MNNVVPFQTKHSRDLTGAESDGPSYFVFAFRAKQDIFTGIEKVLGAPKSQTQDKRRESFFWSADGARIFSKLFFPRPSQKSRQKARPSPAQVLRSALCLAGRKFNQLPVNVKMSNREKQDIAHLVLCKSWRSAGKSAKYTAARTAPLAAGATLRPLHEENPATRTRLRFMFTGDTSCSMVKHCKKTERQFERKSQPITASSNTCSDKKIWEA